MASYLRITGGSRELDADEALSPNEMNSLDSLLVEVPQSLWLPLRFRTLAFAAIRGTVSPGALGLIPLSPHVDRRDVTEPLRAPRHRVFY